MKTFNEKTRLCKAFCSKETKKALPYVMYFGKWFQKIIPLMANTNNFTSKASTWSKVGMINGFKRVEEISKSKEKFVYQVYSKQDIKLDKSKKDAVIMHFKSNVEEKRPFIVIVPGGGYNCVCSLAEGFPTAAAFNKLGYTCFVLNYQVNALPLMPKPIDDLANAIKFINDHADEFNVLKDQYILNGFSAGGNLINYFCSGKVGYKKYNLPKPLMSIPVYAGCDFIDDKIGNEGEYDFKKKFFNNDIKEEKLNDYLIAKNVNSFPKTFFVYAEDDDIVPPSSSYLLGELLEKENIHYKRLIGKTGRHGFGSGEGTSLENWQISAIEFLNN